MKEISQLPFRTSIEQLLIDCITLNNYIKRGERLFDFDNRYKLKLLQDSQSKLASKVAELNNILNPQPMQSVVEIAEDVLK
jgi:multidrug resistance efflux pump